MSVKSVSTTPPAVVETLLKADATRNLHIVGLAIKTIIKDHSLQLQAIERIFRDKNCYTFLIARERKDLYSRDVKFLLPPDEKVKAYYLFISTRDKEDALKEVIEESRSYEENFEKLNNTGFIIVDENINLSQQIRTGFIETIDPNHPELKAGFNVRYLNMPLAAFSRVSRFFLWLGALFFNWLFGRPR
jgi:hypothetical protein